jgi:phosphoribosylformimino-5-aminoimidazole carboxamide ribotide isomerase
MNERSFIVYPAIDLKGGRCVRLVQGDMASAIVFNDDPAAQAQAWEQAGFAWIHVVDLDGAFAGESRNAEAILAIRKTVSCPIQLGGGVRSLAQIEDWLSRGVTRVILGTAAVRDPALVIAAAKTWPGRIAVGIDAKDGKVAVQGWAEATELTAPNLAARFADAGVAAIIYTDVGRDGTGTGLDQDGTRSVAQAAGHVPVIASGGAGAVSDLVAARASGFGGAIAGRALYDGRITPADLRSAGLLAV